EVLEAKGNGEDARHETPMPEGKHDERYDGPIKKRCKNESLSVQSPIDCIEYAKASDQEADQSKIDCGGGGKVGQLQKLGNAPWRNENRNALGQLQPAKGLDGHSAPGIAYRVQQAVHPFHKGLVSGQNTL